MPRPVLSEQARRIFAYVAPFALFLLLTTFETEVAGGYPWLYTGKIVFVTGLWWTLRGRYPRLSRKGTGSAISVGIAGCVLWIAVSGFNLEEPLRDMLPDWLFGGARAAFNPFEQIGSPAARWAFLVMRMFGLAVVVPLVEEVFWRGFLIRYLVRDDFEQLPIGTFTLFSFVVVTILFATVHPEFLAALLWGAAVNGLLYRTKNLWACVVAHMTTNLLLGIYIVVAGQWQLW